MAVVQHSTSRPSAPTSPSSSETSAAAASAYPDSAATSLKPRVVAVAVSDYLTRYSANIHRGVYQIAEEATAAYEDARKSIASFINAPSAREVVMVRNATEAINLVAYSWAASTSIRPTRSC